jgi:hypothetical protein
MESLVSRLKRNSLPWFGSDATKIFLPCASIILLASDTQDLFRIFRVDDPSSYGGIEDFIQAIRRDANSVSVHCQLHLSFFHFEVYGYSSIIRRKTEGIVEQLDGDPGIFSSSPRTYGRSSWMSKISDIFFASAFDWLLSIAARQPC